MWSRLRSLDYDNYRKNLNTAIKTILSSEEPNALKDLLEVRGDKIFFKTGEFANQELNYAHIVSQKTIENLQLDKGLLVSPDNLAPVGERFHMAEYGHSEEVVTRSGLGMSEEAKQGLRALRVERPPNVSPIDLDLDAAMSRSVRRSGQTAIAPTSAAPAAQLSTDASRMVLRNAAKVLSFAADAYAMSQAPDEGTAWETAAMIFAGMLAGKVLLSNPYGIAAVATVGAAYVETEGFKSLLIAYRDFSIEMVNRGMKNFATYPH